MKRWNVPVTPVTGFDPEREDGDMSNAGREHADRRLAQARAAAKPENKARSRKRPGKGTRNRWKKEV